MDWDLPDEEAATVAGLVIHEARTIPEARQAFVFHGFRFEVLRRQKNRIAALRITPMATEGQGEGGGVRRAFAFRRDPPFSRPRDHPAAKQRPPYEHGLQDQPRRVIGPARRQMRRFYMVERVFEVGGKDADGVERQHHASEFS